MLKLSPRTLKLNRLFSTQTKSVDLSIELPTNENSLNLFKIRHSSAHIMAMAVQKIFKSAQVTIGPCIDNGFFYDFCIPNEQIASTDLKKIKKEMDNIIKRKLPITREVISYDEAKKRILEINEPFKLEILEGIKDSKEISIYHIGNEWWDLCSGPHVENTGDINPSSIQLQFTAGSYWRGIETNPALQRVYGTAWENPEQLDIYLLKIQEAKRRDHRLIGKELDLFSIQEEAGGGLVFWHPKGSIIRRIIEDYWKKEHLDNGYELVTSPHIANINLWKTSGHFDFYRSDMFSTISVENDEYQLKPMNCPFHCLMFKDRLKSYRDLPIRWAELGTVYRYERSGTLHGLFRVRGFTQDDAHIFCLPDQLENEIVGVLNLVESILSKFGFQKYDIMLSTRPEKSVGSDEIWSKSTDALINALNKKNWKYQVDEGGGAFYGPKIDIKVSDAIGRKWQCSTIQCDFNLPERFDLQYTSKDQVKQRPIMVHRAIFGSLERFFGVLIENTAGDFPLWISPIQLRLIPINEEAERKCQEIQSLAKSLGIRVEVDMSDNRMAKKIRNAEQEKIPIVGIIGQNELTANTISVRLRKHGDIGALDSSNLLNLLSNAVKENIQFDGIHQILKENIV